MFHRDENAAVNLYRYPEEPGNLAHLGGTRVESATSAGSASAPTRRLSETRMLGLVGDHESQ
jgi:transposase